MIEIILALGCTVAVADSFIAGLKKLLQDDFWKVQGEKDYQYFKEHHTTEIGVQKHIELYKELIN
jgi:hypothetical protein